MMQQPNEHAPMDTVFQDATTHPAAEAKPKTPVWAYIVCGWPLILVVIGGAIGGGLGGAACFANLSIFRSQLHPALKALFIATTGMLAVGIWLAIGVVIVLLRGGVPE